MGGGIPRWTCEPSGNVDDAMFTCFWSHTMALQDEALCVKANVFEGYPSATEHILSLR